MMTPLLSVRPHCTRRYTPRYLHRSSPLVAKGTFIAGSGLAGFAMWEAGGDYNDILLDSIRSALGL